MFRSVNRKERERLGNRVINGEMMSYIEIWCEGMVKVKVKFALEQDTKDQRGCRGIALLFL